jgi:hypothetical protein
MREEIARILARIQEERLRQVNSQDTYSRSQEPWAYVNDTEDMEKLLRGDVNHQNQNKHGVTPLIVAAENGNIEAMNFLVTNGAKVDLADNDKRTPLIAAAKKGDIEAMNFLLEQGANPNHSDIIGNTPLTYVVILGLERAVNLLIKHGARANENELRTALYRNANNIVSNENRVNIALALLDTGARYPAADNQPFFTTNSGNELTVGQVVECLEYQKYQQRLQVFLMGTLRRDAAKSSVLMLPVDALGMIASHAAPNVTLSAADKEEVVARLNGMKQSRELPNTSVREPSHQPRAIYL